MEINLGKTRVDKSHDFKTINYGVNVDNLPLLFQMLRTNLYSDLYGSIIRELVSNVIDSHTEANKPAAIGEIEWVESNKMLGVDCQLIVRDYGVGLSPERMETVYGNYLSSTKRGDNSQVGGFGLGSKVPFAYTDSFFVQTIYNKVKTKYLCYIDSTQLGAISILSIEDCDQENQTEIIIPIKKEYEDKVKFQQAIIRQLSYVRNMKYIGIEGPDTSVRFEDANCVVLNNPPIKNAHVILGCIAYEINFAALGINTEGLIDARIGIKFDIGELQPTLSREDLFWNEKVKKKVEDKLNKARKSVRVQLEAELSGEKDYAKWYANVELGRTNSFPKQWGFSQMGTAAELDFNGQKLEVQFNMADWFAGHSIRWVRKYNGYSRRRATADPIYSTEKPTMEQLRTLPVYKLERNLSAAGCLYLFGKHGDGFLAISPLTIKAVEPELKIYEKACHEWRKNLPSFDDLDLPDDYSDNWDDEYKAKYRELVRQRKLEGKFTAKKLYKLFDEHLKIINSFAYNMYEGKFEEQDKKIIIYGFQEDHEQLCQAAAILFRSVESFNDYSSEKLVFYKIGRHYTKHFASMPNAYYVTNVLDLKTPINEKLGRIASAIRLRPSIHIYHMLNYFDKINKDMQIKYLELHQDIDYNTQHRGWVDAAFDSKIMSMCNNILNPEMEQAFQEIRDYFIGAELLKTVNFRMNSREHRVGNSEGSSALYIKTYTLLNRDFIRSYLIAAGKEVDPLHDDKALLFNKEDILEEVDESSNPDVEYEEELEDLTEEEFEEEFTEEEEPESAPEDVIVTAI